MNLIGADMAAKCSERVYSKIGLQGSSSADILKNFDVVELHDCFSANELCTYEALNLCPKGQAGPAIDRGDFTYGG
jgi:acetyl-CoA acetyltransferase